MKTQEKEFKDLRPLSPVKFPTKKGKTYRLEGSKGKSTRVVIEEIKELSKKDIFESPSLDHDGRQQ